MGLRTLHACIVSMLEFPAPKEIFPSHPNLLGRQHKSTSLLLAFHVYVHLLERGSSPHKYHHHKTTPRPSRTMAVLNLCLRFDVVVGSQNRLTIHLYINTTTVLTMYGALVISFKS